MRERYQHAGAVLRAILGVAALGATLSLGGTLAAQVGGGGATMTAATPIPVGRLADTPDPVTARGRVAEIFGSHFILDDGTGRALVDFGPRGDAAVPLARGATVTVQGRFARGLLHAAFLADDKGTVTPLRPEPGPRGPGDRMGARMGRRGPPPCGPEGMPPPGGPGGMAPPGGAGGMAPLDGAEGTPPAN